MFYFYQEPFLVIANGICKHFALYPSPSLTFPFHLLLTTGTLHLSSSPAYANKARYYTYPDGTWAITVNVENISRTASRDIPKEQGTGDGGGRSCGGGKDLIPRS